VGSFAEAERMHSGWQIKNFASPVTNALSRWENDCIGTRIGEKKGGVFFHKGELTRGGSKGY